MAGGRSGESNGEDGGLSAIWANPGYRFVIFFLPYLGIAAFAYPILAKRYHEVIQGIILGTTQILFHIFALFSDRITNSQKLLLFDGFFVSIVDECTGIYEVIIFTAAVLAFPTSLKNKLIGIVIGNAIIYAFNILRIVILMLIGRHWLEVFEFMHLYFWQATMILMIASVWLLWLLKVVRREDSTASDTH